MTLSEIYEQVLAQCLDAGIGYDEAHKIATETAEQIARMKQEAA